MTDEQTNLGTDTNVVAGPATVVPAVDEVAAGAPAEVPAVDGAEVAPAADATGEEVDSEIATEEDPEAVAEGEEEVAPAL